ncbi:hypothetical protein Y032_0275g1073 [Ancylostoma ceylanicum]|nr:hypothetical protein Y032_0275g1073 [Ancylostoma ceylanicum]
MHKLSTTLAFETDYNIQKQLQVVCLREEPKSVLGMHIVGPNAAEVIQGYAVAVKAGITFDQLIGTVAIHPCSSEEFLKMRITKRSGEDPRVQGCCG